MQILNQPEYYRRREGEQRALAGRTTDAEAVSFHTMLADRYAGFVREAERFGTMLYDPAR